jgi:hypothetical protein
VVELAIWGMSMKALATKMLMESNPDVRNMVGRNPDECQILHMWTP